MKLSEIEKRNALACGPTTEQVVWLIAEVERLTAERDEFAECYRLSTVSVNHAYDKGRDAGRDEVLNATMTTTKEDLPQLRVFNTLREEHERALARAEARGMLRAAKIAEFHSSTCFGSLYSGRIARDIREATKIAPKRSCTICQGAHLEILCLTRLGVK